MCSLAAEDAVRLGEHVAVTLADGNRVAGTLDALQMDKAVLLVKPQGQPPQAIRFAEIKLMRLPKARRVVRDLIPAEGEGDDPAEAAWAEGPIAKQQFEVVFKDGDRVDGETLGVRTDRHGMFFFPVPKGGHFSYLFIPNEAIEDYHVGPRLGEMLVKDNLLTEEQIEGVLSEQQDQRNQPLGEMLRTQAVVTSNELERALERQKSAPNLRLGEILVTEGLINDGQLMEALEAQKEQRGTPLGEILVEQGLLTSRDIQRSLAKKLNIPFVDLRKFPIDPLAVEKVPQELARKHKMVPLALLKSKLVVALENPMAWQPLEETRFLTQLTVEPVMAPADEIDRALDALYSADGLDEATFDELELAEVEDEDELHFDEDSVADNMVVRLVNKIIVDAYQQGVSDIHIEPYAESKTVVRYRKDGTLAVYLELPSRLRSAVVARIKIMAGLDISERRKPQDGKIDFRRFSRLKIELRVATIPTAGGREDVVMRILAGGKPIPVEKLGLIPANEERLKRLVAKPYGLFFVCGPTGSGKTTTLHSILGYLNTPETKIWTAEDPVEITQEGLRQVQVNPKVGLTFANAMRAFLRADPDIIMVGEMRDKETTSTGIEASLTGHLVFATLHTNSAPESILRLLDMGMDPFNFADALVGVLAQRLGRTLCKSCKEAYAPDEEEMRELLDEYCYELREIEENAHERVRREWEARYGNDGKFTLYRAKGCEACDDSGYKGRVGIHELLEASDTVKKHILEQATVSTITATALGEGMRTLKQDGIEKVLQGLTDIHQVRKVCIK